ncbi:recombinase family protein [Nocardia cyriacigeorgica]|uniref:recombinase family protein n=1 Tax=Nocardia cyriacigeorgica TaxID=135487 RepID=UPI0024590B72|nr:recombinase family protein [Nocardia cyriacigeorgica]
MRLIGYVRVSTEEQGDVGYGLAAQRDTMEDWSAARGHELLTVTTDVISTGKVDRMYGRAVAIAAIEMGVADGLLIRALDRGTRDQLDGAQLFKRATDYGWRLLDCDGTDSGVRFPQGSRHRVSRIVGPAGRMSVCLASVGRSRPSTRSRLLTG